MTSIITYEQMKDFYSKFKDDLPKDPIIRYFKEYSFMNSLIEFAKKQGLEKDVFEYEKIKEIAAKELRALGCKNF